MKTNLSQGIKASVAFFIASLVTKGISFITTPIFTRLMSTDDFGVVSIYYTWMQLFGILAMFCLCYGIFNVGMSENPDKRYEFSFSLLILSNIFTLAFTGILFCLYPFVSTYINLSVPLIVLMAISFMVQPAYNFWMVKQRYEYKYKSTIIWSLICSIVSPLIAILLILLDIGISNVYARIFGSEIILIIIHIGFYIYIGIKAKFKINIKFWKTAILFNLPLIPHYLSSYLLNSSDKLMISVLVGDSETAFYSVAYSIASLALIVWTAIDSSLVPYTFENLKKGDFQSVKKVASPLLFLFATGCLMVIVLAPEAVKIIGTDAYTEAIYVIPPVVGGVFFQVQYFLYSNILYFYKKPRFVMFGSVAAMIVNFILNYVFISLYGYIAAGYTTLVCFFLQALIDFIFMRKVVKNNIYNMKFILFLSLIVVFVSLFGNLLYSFTIIRYLIIFVFFILIIIFRKKIINLFIVIKKKEI